MQHLFLLILIFEILTFLTVGFLVFRNYFNSKYKFKVALHYLLLSNFMSLPFVFGVLWCYKVFGGDLLISSVVSSIRSVASVFPSFVYVANFWFICMMLTYFFKIGAAPFAG